MTDIIFKGGQFDKMVLMMKLFVFKSVQSTIQQSSRGPIPSSASHGCGSLPSDHARRDTSAAGESGLRLPAAADQQVMRTRQGLGLGYVAWA